MEIAFFTGLLLLFVVLSLCARNREMRHWNNGICAKHNEPWQFFDMDSQGGRGYQCRDETLWISYGVDVKAG